MSVKGGARQATARLVQGLILTAGIAGVIVTADGRAPDDIGAVVALVSVAVLITWQLRRIRRLLKQPTRDELLDRQVAKNAAAAAEALRCARACERRIEEFATLVAEAAQAAGITSPDTDETQPRMRIVGNLQAQALAV